MAAEVRTAVVGVGAFGRFHAQKHAAIEGARLVGVADNDGARAAAVGAELGVPAFDDYRALFGKVDAVSVAVPTRAHAEVAGAFLENGVHVLLEKPMTGDIEKAAALTRLAEARGLVFQVGHIERFSAAYAAVAPHVTRPLYIESYRIAPFQPRGTDVNVILDLMIHDIDLILGLVDAPVSTVDAIGAPVLTPQEDLANTRIGFANGCVANITASRVSSRVERRMRIFQSDSYITVDFVESKVVRLRRRAPGQATAAGVADFASLGEAAFEKDEWLIGKQDSLEAEVRAFVEAVATGRAPRVPGAAGCEALRIAVMIGNSLQAHREALFGGGASPVLRTLS